jgi:PadR family transcriptional regulator, regulatory protein AphA
MSEPLDLTTTAYALLGQLALRPWSVYDLTKNIGRTLHWFWPRAESVLYAEVKRLAATGLATAEVAAGRRARERTVYAITPTGRDALAAWLATAPAGFSLHAEPLLRVHLAPYGTRADLVRALEATRAEAEQLLRQAVVIGLEFAEGRHQFQQQVHVRAILFDYLWSWGLTTHLWSERWLAELQHWPDLALTADAERAALAAIRRSLASAPAHLAPRSAGGFGDARPTSVSSSVSQIASANSLDPVEMKVEGGDLRQLQPLHKHGVIGIGKRQIRIHVQVEDAPKPPLAR